jgi:disulfide bond formation protein DsbB
MMQFFWSSPVLMFLISGFGIGGFLGGSVLEKFFGFLGCILCRTERLIILVAGILCFWSLVWRMSRWGRYSLVGSAFFWLAGGVVSLYHAAIQYGLLKAPHFCTVQESVGKTFEEQFDRFISAPIKVSCAKRTMDLFGVPASLYLGVTCLLIFGICLMLLKRFTKESLFDER